MSKKKILYISYTGLLEPLGRSQILAYLSRLSDEYQFTIVSFEKIEEFCQKEKVAALKKECVEYGIDWQPKIYHNRPRLLATLWDLGVLTSATYAHSRSESVELVHCRSYIPAISAWCVGKITKVPFVFDMRALWIDEKVTAGLLMQDGFTFKALKWFEKNILTDSSSVVSLTEAAVDYLMNEYPNLNRNKFSVIPTCVNLDLFPPRKKCDAPKDLIIGSVGSIASGWFPNEWMLHLYALTRKIDPSSKLLVITRDAPETILNLLKGYGLSKDEVDIRAADARAVASEMHKMSYGLVVNKADLGRLGSFPTRMGEFLACGIPVLGNDGVGDVANIIRRYKVGVVIPDGSTESLLKGKADMDDLLKDQGLYQRCIHAANEYFSADAGAEKYRKIYKSITSLN